jgi:hypothetical protein
MRQAGRPVSQPVRVAAGRYAAAWASAQVRGESEIIMAAPVNALVITWKRAVHGREAAASEAFGNFMGFLGESKGTGAIGEFQPVILQMPGGEIRGFTLIYGGPDQLVEFKRNDQFVQLMLAADMSVDGLAMHDGHGGEAVMQAMQEWSAAIGD